MFLHLFVVILDNHQMTCHTPIPCYATFTKFSLLHLNCFGFGPFHQEVGEFLFFTWEIIKNGINILVFIIINMFVYGNEFQHLEIEFKPKLLVILYLSIKKSLQKQIQ